MKVLKIIAIINTLVVSLYFISTFLDDGKDYIIPYINNLSTNYILSYLTIQYLSIVIFLNHIWRVNKKNRKIKINNSLMVLFLGFIGMWLYISRKS